MAKAASKIPIPLKQNGSPAAIGAPKGKITLLSGSVLRALALYSSGEPAKAIEMFDGLVNAHKAIFDQEDDLAFEARTGGAEAYQEWLQYRIGRICQHMADGNPDVNPISSFVLAQLLYQADQLQDAIPLLRQAVLDAPTFRSAAEFLRECLDDLEETNTELDKTPSVATPECMEFGASLRGDVKAAIIKHVDLPADELEEIAAEVCARVQKACPEKPPASDRRTTLLHNPPNELKTKSQLVPTDPPQETVKAAMRIVSAYQRRKGKVEFSEAAHEAVREAYRIVRAATRRKKAQATATITRT